MDQIAKEIVTPRRPHVMRTKAQWRELVAQFNHGNLNVREFCQQQQLTPSSFHNWRKRLSETVNPSPGFVALDIPVDATVVEPLDWEVELSLGAGMTLRLRHR